MYLDIYVCMQMYMYVHTHITYTHACIHTCVFAYMYVSHRGVFRTIKSLVHALGACSPLTVPTTNSTLLTFIEQVNLYNLKKMVLQFAIHFVPTLGYTYMVYTLNN